MMRASSDGQSAKLWAITCYFNPIGYKRRLINYHTFRQRLKTPLVTVELSFDEKFELEPSHADILIQLHGRDILWQKERLLNVALQSLPGDCEHIAWLDCDIVFQDDDWIRHASQALNQFAVIHLFKECHDLSRDAELDNCAHQDSKQTSVVHKLAVGEWMPDNLRWHLFGHGTTAGFAWAARRDILDRHGFYDACILGSGDRAILCAALGEFQYGIRPFNIRDARLEHYLVWAKCFFGAVQDGVGYIDEVVYHLWHGDLEHRNYVERHEDFKKFNFNPYTDIAIDESGCWRWNTNRKEMHQYVEHYFQSRKEDG